MSENILLVEDEKKLAFSIQRQLEITGYNVTIQHDGLEAYSHIMENSYQLIILDWKLPGMTGVDICKKIRKNSLHPPILLLTAMASTSHKVEGFDVGADDYLTKPFEFPELLARIKALIRRSQPEHLMKMTIDDLVVDPVKRQVTRNGTLVNLSSQEYNLLEYLMRRQGEALSRETLLQEIWNLDFDPQSNIIDVYVNYLRKKIAYKGSRPLIHTVRGVGYKISL